MHRPARRATAVGGPEFVCAGTLVRQGTGGKKPGVEPVN